MRDWLRQSLLHSFSLFLLAGFYPGIIVPGQLPQWLWAGLVMALLDRLVKPLIKLLTLGLLSWAGQALVLFLAVNIVSGLFIVGFTAPAWQQAGFSIPALRINLPVSYLLASILLTFIYKLLDGVLCPD